MDAKDKLVFEDITMSLAAYIHSLAVQMNIDARNRKGLDLAWEEFKQDAGKFFIGWHKE
jgi:hypothetical protein